MVGVTVYVHGAHLVSMTVHMVGVTVLLVGVWWVGWWVRQRTIKFIRKELYCTDCYVVT